MLQGSRMKRPTSDNLSPATVFGDFSSISNSEDFCNHALRHGKHLHHPYSGSQAYDLKFPECTSHNMSFWYPSSKGRDVQILLKEHFLAVGWPKLLFPFSPGKEFYVLPGNDRDSDSRQRWEDIISLVMDPPP